MGDAGHVGSWRIRTKLQGDEPLFEKSHLVAFLSKLPHGDPQALLGKDFNIK